MHAVQVCVRAWPTCRGRAAHYSNPLCRRSWLVCLYHFTAASTMYTFLARARSTFPGSRPNIHAEHAANICENVLTDTWRRSVPFCSVPNQDTLPRCASDRYLSLLSPLPLLQQRTLILRRILRSIPPVVDTAAPFQLVSRPRCENVARM